MKRKLSLEENFRGWANSAAAKMIMALVFVVLLLLWVGDQIASRNAHNAGRLDWCIHFVAHQHRKVAGHCGERQGVGYADMAGAVC